MDTKEKAIAYFREGHGFNCAQSVAAAIAPWFDLDVKTALKMAAAFGGGIGRSGGICGAVSSALMAIGLRYGMTDIKDQDSKKRTYQEVRGFIARFTEKWGTCQCRELLDCDIGTAEGFKRFQEQNLAAALCTGYIRDAVAILEEML